MEVEHKHLLQKHEILLTFSINKFISNEDINRLKEDIKNTEKLTDDKQISDKATQIISKEILSETIPGTLYNQKLSAESNSKEKVKSSENKPNDSKIENLFNELGLDKQDLLKIHIQQEILLNLSNKQINKEDSIEILYNILNILDPETFPMEDDS